MGLFLVCFLVGWFLTPVRHRPLLADHRPRAFHRALQRRVSKPHPDPLLPFRFVDARPVQIAVCGGCSGDDHIHRAVVGCRRSLRVRGITSRRNRNRRGHRDDDPPVILHPTKTA